MSAIDIPGFSALQCVISSLRDTAHFNDEEGDLTDKLRDLRDWLCDRAAAQAAQPEAVGLIRAMLHNAMDRMDRARNLLTDGNPRPECNWGMLDTSDLRKALASAPTPEPMSAPTAETEVRADGQTVRIDRWQVGIRQIVALLWGNRAKFEVDDVVEAVRALIPEPNGDDEGLVRAILATPPSAATEPSDAERLDWLREECCDLRCISSPTGGDDYDIRWVVIQHHMAKPHEREIGESYTDEPRDAIDAAIRATKGGKL